MSNGICPRCKGEVEDVEHLFFKHPHSQRRWMDLARELQGTCLGHFFEDYNLWRIIQKVTEGVRHHAILLIIFVEMIGTLWDERNKA